MFTASFPWQVICDRQILPPDSRDVGWPQNGSIFYNHYGKCQRCDAGIITIIIMPFLICEYYFLHSTSFTKGVILFMYVHYNWTIFLTLIIWGIEGNTFQTDYDQPHPLFWPTSSIILSNLLHYFAQSPPLFWICCLCAECFLCSPPHPTFWSMCISYSLPHPLSPILY